MDDKGLRSDKMRNQPMGRLLWGMSLPPMLSCFLTHFIILWIPYSFPITI